MKDDLLDKRYKRLIEILDNNTIKNLDICVELLSKSLTDDKVIVLNTDFDVDGMVSMAIPYIALRDVFGFKGKVHIINNDRKYGRGINKHAIDKLKDIHKHTKVDLFLTGDHGSTDKENVKTIMDMGIDVIVTDHHLYRKEEQVTTPYFLNPVYEDNHFRFISGATVLYVLFYKLAKYLDYKKYGGKLQSELLPLAALTTISDMMDMRIPLNRCIVHNGIKLMTINRKGIYREMIKVVKTKHSITSKQLGAMISPIINSAGRMNSSITGINFLISEDWDAKSNFILLQELNKQRKLYLEVLMKKTKDSLSLYRKKYKNINVVVLPEGGGVAGIIASRLGELYSKPSFVLTRSDGGYSCSARAIVEGVHIEETIVKLKKLNVVVDGGGHKGAGGCFIASDKLNLFLEELNKLFVGVSTSDFKSDVIFSNKYSLTEIHKAVSYLEPYGNFFPVPVFKQTFKIIKMQRLGMTAHYKLTLEKDRKIMDAMCFNMLDKVKKLRMCDTVNVTFVTEFKNDYISIIVNDIVLVADDIKDFNTRTVRKKRKKRKARNRRNKLKS